MTLLRNEVKVEYEKREIVTTFGFYFFTLPFFRKYIVLTITFDFQKFEVWISFDAQIPALNSRKQLWL